MAEVEQKNNDKNRLKVKTPFGDFDAGGPILIAVIALAAVGALALREHTKREAAEHVIVDSLNRQNELLHAQTDTISAQIEEVKCQLGINIFTSGFSRGAIEWDLLPPQLHACYPEYAKKLPKRGG